MKHKAQSLIETIVAIGIVVTAIVAILSVGMANLVIGGQSAERVMAVNLAREGIEVVMAIRSSNWLDSAQNWPYGLGETDDDYIVNFSSESLTTAEFSGAEIIENCTNCYLCRQVDDDTHIHCVQEEIFRRMITISNVADELTGNCNEDCEKKVVSTVYWKERGYPHTMDLEARLTDWR